MSCDVIKNDILHKYSKEIVWKLKHIVAHEKPLV